MKARVLVFALLLGLGLVSLPQRAQSAGNEARCAELDAQFGAGTCHCSEPLNTNSYTNLSNNEYWAANDTTTKKCNADLLTGAILTSSSPSGAFGTSASGWIALNSGEAINALPAAHTNTWVVAQNGAKGVVAGGSFLAGAATKFRNIRFYRYISQNFTFTDPQQVGCLNSAKNIQLGPQFLSSGGPLLNRSYGSTEQFYDISNTLAYNTSYDCCTSPLGNDPAAPMSGPSVYLGNWMRYELVYRNADPSDAGPTTFTLYRKNVTTNGPEYVITDSRTVASTVPPNQWPLAATNSLKVTQRYNAFGIDMFRGQNCTGFEALSHVLLASFQTEQRIGAAQEIEGGAGIMPNAPTNLRFGGLEVGEWAAVAMWVMPFALGAIGLVTTRRCRRA